MYIYQNQKYIKYKYIMFDEEYVMYCYMTYWAYIYDITKNLMY